MRESAQVLRARTDAAKGIVQSVYEDHPELKQCVKSFYFHGQTVTANPARAAPPPAPAFAPTPPLHEKLPDTSGGKNKDGKDHSGDKKDKKQADAKTGEAKGDSKGDSKGDGKGVERGGATTVRVRNASTMDAVSELSRLHPELGDPLALIFASFRKFGGGIENVGNLQEEGSLRQTSIFGYKGLEDHYPLRGTDMTLYPKVLRVFGNDHKPLKKKERAAMGLLFAAAKKLDQYKERLDEKEAADAKAQMRKMLLIARVNRYKLLVLGAWGCGNYNNPPLHMAELWRSVLAEFRDDGFTVVFAIPEARHKKSAHKKKTGAAAAPSYDPFSNFSVFRHVLAPRRTDERPPAAKPAPPAAKQVLTISVSPAAPLPSSISALSCISSSSSVGGGSSSAGGGSSSSAGGGSSSSAGGGSSSSAGAIIGVGGGSSSSSAIIGVGGGSSSSSSIGPSTNGSASWSPSRFPSASAAPSSASCALSSASRSAFSHSPSSAFSPEKVRHKPAWKAAAKSDAKGGTKSDTKSDTKGCAKSEAKGEAGASPSQTSVQKVTEHAAKAGGVRPTAPPAPPQKRKNKRGKAKPAPAQEQSDFLGSSRS